jgi:hypothetical protein
MHSCADVFSFFISLFDRFRECTRVIRFQQLPHRTRPYIIAQTANVSEEFREKTRASGMGQSRKRTRGKTLRISRARC